ncbi:hypothetical protein EVAR_97081_1 [Eumeta japonica]|uniref:Uncharacterized protein n=1 Tax=Eumeta variegata TaxID=151549 RepID=A0A4C1X4M4_EUMVA|nr:hypothetical protein EVAR_97081_1 [Eumeta japonica]
MSNMKNLVLLHVKTVKLVSVITVDVTLRESDRRDAGHRTIAWPITGSLFRWRIFASCPLLDRPAFKYYRKRRDLRRPYTAAPSGAHKAAGESLEARSAKLSVFRTHTQEGPTLYTRCRCEGARVCVKKGVCAEKWAHTNTDLLYGGYREFADVIVPFVGCVRILPTVKDERQTQLTTTQQTKRLKKSDKPPLDRRDRERKNHKPVPL